MGELASSGQLRMVFVRRALIVVPLIVLLGFVSGSVGGNGGDNPWYAALEKPWFNPPDIAFPIAWTTLYILIGLALTLVLAARGAATRKTAVILFAVQFALNLVWSPVFFGMREPGWALVVIVAMIVFTAATTISFWRIRRSAGLLMLPYLAWLCFAGALNWQIVRLNPNVASLVVPGSSTQIQLKR